MHGAMIDKPNVAVLYSSENLWRFGWLAGLTAQSALLRDRVKVCFTKGLKSHMNIAVLPPHSLQVKCNDVLA